MLKTNCCWNRWQSWYKKFEVVHCTSCWLPIVGQLWSLTDFPFKWISVFLSSAYEAMMEPLAFHRVVALLRADRSHEEKLVRPRLFALSQSRLRTVIGSLDLFRKVSVFIWALILSLSIVHSLAKFYATLLSQSACREVSSSVRSSKPGAQRFRSWGSPFWIMPPDCPLSFPEF